MKWWELMEAARNMQIDPMSDVIAIYYATGDESPGEYEHDITEIVIADPPRLKPTVLLQ